MPANVAPMLDPTATRARASSASLPPARMALKTLGNAKPAGVRFKEADITFVGVLKNGTNSFINGCEKAPCKFAKGPVRSDWNVISLAAAFALSTNGTGGLVIRRASSIAERCAASSGVLPVAMAASYAS